MIDMAKKNCHGMNDIPLLKNSTCQYLETLGSSDGYSEIRSYSYYWEPVNKLINSSNNDLFISQEMGSTLQ